jgi:hypothetical protein
LRLRCGSPPRGALELLTAEGVSGLTEALLDLEALAEPNWFAFPDEARRAAVASALRGPHRWHPPRAGRAGLAGRLDAAGCDVAGQVPGRDASVERRLGQVGQGEARGQLAADLAGQ